MSKRTRLLSKLKHVYSHNTKLVLDVSNDDIGLIIEALEKQVGKKIERYGSNIIGEMTFNCPSCNLEYYVTDYEDFNYCPNCGQKIDWSEADENKEVD